MCLVAEAIFGLVGVIVGALTTGGTQVFLEWRRERRDVHRAKRLVAAELLGNASYLAAVSELKQVAYVETGAPLATSAWEQTRSDLAATLDEALWTRLAVAYVDLDRERERLNVGMKVTDLNKPSSALDEMAESVGRLAEELIELRRELRAV